jgi:hypothetical protein
VELPLVTLELDVIRQDVVRYLEVARTRPERFRPEFAAILDELAGRLRGYQDERAERAEDALLAGEEIVTALRSAARINPGTFIPVLPRSLTSLADVLDLAESARAGRKRQRAAAAHGCR